MKKIKMIITATFMVSFFLFIIAGPARAAGPANMTYDAWVSRSWDSPPHNPFQDCFRFTSNTMSIDGCGDSGPLVVLPLNPYMTIWIGQVPCGGLNLYWVGTAINMSMIPPYGANVIGASGWGITELTNFGAEGVANPNCASSTLEGNLYSAE